MPKQHVWIMPMGICTRTELDCARTKMHPPMIVPEPKMCCSFLLVVLKLQAIWKNCASLPEQSCASLAWPMNLPCALNMQVICWADMLQAPTCTELCISKLAGSFQPGSPQDVNWVLEGLPSSVHDSPSFAKVCASFYWEVFIRG